MKKLVSILFVCSLLLVGCGGTKEEENVITIGATAAPHAEILEALKEEAKAEGYTLKVQVFDDYQVINDALHDGEVFANFFQHRPYLEEDNEKKGYELVDLVGVHFEPLGIYSKDASGENKDFSIDDVKEGAIIAVPDDKTNGARALLLLESKGIIELAGDKGLESTVADVKTFYKNVEIKEFVAAQIPGALPDVDYAVINGNYALTNEIDDKYIVGEDAKSEAAIKYENVVAVNKADVDSEKAKVLKKILNSDACREFIEKTYKEDIVVATF